MKLDYPPMPSTIYCPYKDTNIPIEQSSTEHIIPLSLGGADDFTILVDKQINSTLGHAVDGVIANDPIIAMIRAKSGASGQSGVPAKAYWKKTYTADGRPLQAVISQNSFQLYDPIEKRHLEEHESQGLMLKSSLKMNPFVRIPFAAKVALGAGHFLFGDIFQRYAEHCHLRVLLSNFDDLNPDLLRDNQVTYLDRFHDRNDDRKLNSHRIIEKVISHFGASSVVIGYGDQSISFSIGLFGEWQSTITLPAQSEKFPADHEFDLGHFIMLPEGRMQRMSYREAVYGLAQTMFGDELPSFSEVLKAVSGREGEE